MTQKAKWTVLTYIAAHNNLSALGHRSLTQILKVGSTPHVVQGALYDGVKGAARYVMDDPGLVSEQQLLGCFDSGDPDNLIKTARWLFEAKPAERYGLVLWSHGTGWEPGEFDAISKEARPSATDGEDSRERESSPGGTALFRTTLRRMLKPADRPERAILFDDGSSHSLDTIELARVVDEIAQATGQPLDLLGMDACLMASLEVAYELCKSVRYLAASQELVPGYSWPYESIFTALRDAPDQSGADLARRIVTEFVKFYQQNPPGIGDVTKVALDLNKLAGVGNAVNAFVDALMSDLQEGSDLMWSAQQSTQKSETRNGARTNTKFQFHLWDVGTLTQTIARNAKNPTLQRTAQAVHDAFLPSAGTVLAESHIGSWFDGIAGTSVYLPRSPTRVSPHYSQLHFAKDTRWGQFVPAYWDFTA